MSAALALLLAGLAAPRVEVDTDPARDSSAVLAAFASVTEAVAPAVAAIEIDGRRVALATVVDASGWLVTKASELDASATSRCRCRLADGRLLDAEIVARDPSFDLALLSVQAVGLAAVTLEDAARDVALGRLVVAADAGGAPLGVGVVGVLPRSILGGRAWLGVVLAFGVEGAVVERVVPDSPAALSGLLAGDRILAFAGEPVLDRSAAVARVRGRRAGERLTLSLLRGDERMEREVRLAAAGAGRRRSNAAEGEQSEVRSGFPSALQHDVVLGVDRCGGPIVDVAGRFVGINVARAGRVATYAVPAAELFDVVARLRGSR